MRFVRPLIGLLFGAAGLLSMFTAGMAWQLGQHRDADGAFSAELSPVHSDGYAVVVPDLAGTLRRHGAARLLGSTELRISVTAPTPVVLALAPATEVNQYLDGVARAAITGVGYSVGAQPVSVTNVAGTAVPALLPDRSTWTVATGWLPWTVRSDTPTSLLVQRADGKPGLTVTFAASLQPPGSALALGALVFVSGLLLLLVAGYLVRPVSSRRSRRSLSARGGERFVVVAPEYEHPEYEHPEYEHPEYEHPEYEHEEESGWVVGAYEPEPTPPAESPYVHTAT
jgi:hypothetical protein